MEASRFLNSIKEIVIVLLIILFWPLGLLLMFFLTKWSKRVKIIVSCVAVFLSPVTYGIIVMSVFEQSKFSGTSMESNIKDGQSITINKLAYKFSEPQRGDVVVFKPPIVGEEDNTFTKRVIGLPGETVKISGGKVFISGVLFDEPYLETNATTEGGTFSGDGQTITISQNNYFVLGDNRDHSSDSRYFGFVPKGNIIGKI